MTMSAARFLRLRLHVTYVFGRASASEALRVPFAKHIRVRYRKRHRFSAVRISNARTTGTCAGEYWSAINGARSALVRRENFASTGPRRARKHRSPSCARNA